MSSKMFESFAELVHHLLQSRKETDGNILFQDFLKTSRLELQEIIFRNKLKLSSIDGASYGWQL